MQTTAIRSGNMSCSQQWPQQLPTVVMSAMLLYGGGKAKQQDVKSAACLFQGVQSVLVGFNTRNFVPNLQEQKQKCFGCSCLFIYLLEGIKKHRQTADNGGTSPKLNYE